MAQIPTGLVSHSRKVCSLYKRVIRALEDWHPQAHKFRYHCVLMRDQFDKNKNIRDLRLAKKLLLEGEEKLFKKAHPLPYVFPTSPNGSAFERESYIPDRTLDYWHPLEKACYPKYFARREQMKDEYIEWYFKTYPEEKEKEKIGDH